MDLKLSVIIPVYNTESWLRQCLDSVANQTLKEIEIICVNDGSSDNSGAILDEYAEKDNRFKVIHKNNGGPVSARRAGLNTAAAKYICYVDSDDWIEPEMLNNDYEAAIQTDADVLINRRIFIENKSESYISESTIPAGIYQNDDLAQQIIARMMRKDNNSIGMIGSLWAKLFKKSLIEKCDALLDDRITIHEDWIGFYSSVAHSNTVTVTDGVYYHYRIDHTSTLSNSKKDDYLLNLNMVFNILKTSFSTAKYSKLLLTELNKLMGRALFISIKHLMGKDGYRYSYGYVFPFQDIAKGSRLLLYGAGYVGIAYYRQLITTGYCSEVVWVDQKWKELSDKGMPVKPPEEMEKYEFDAAVIALLDEDRTHCIREYLFKKGVQKERIIWRNPIISTLD